MTESPLQTALLLAAPMELPDLRLFRRNVGVAAMGKHVVRFAIKGQCDLMGYWKGGRAIEVELKAAGGRMRPEQKQWAAFCVSWGVPHVVLQARAGETVEETVKRWCGELRNAT
jgi:hypothetical protein